MQSRTEDILQAMIDGTDSSELAPPQSRVEVLLQRILDKMNAGGGGGGGLPIHICTQDEYDAMTRVPTVQNPDEETLYLVPSAGSSSGNLFNEWIYVDSSWELVGSASIDVPVEDVQINGTSIVNGEGVADIPIANNTNPGVVKVSGNGLQVDNNILKIQRASDSTIKDGTGTNAPIVSVNQHAATFYGLAKAAGDTTQSQSSNPVGTYTDAAKAAIQSMIGAVASNQGSANAGKVLGIGSDGSVSPVSVGSGDVIQPEKIQALVAAGKARDYFKIGDVIYIPWTNYTPSTPIVYQFPFVVVHIGDAYDNQDVKHENALWLMAMYAEPEEIVFDAAEDWVVDLTEEPNALAGWYYWGLSGTDYTALDLSAGDAIPTTYDSVHKCVFNQLNTLRYGYNRWSKSAYRQWLNSAAAKNTNWWTPQHDGDVAPTTTYTNKPGWLYGFENRWLDIIKPVKVQTSCNTVTDGGVTDVTYDRFFLPSLEQMYGSPQIAGVEGDYWEYWKEETGLDAPSNGSSSDTNDARKILSVVNYPRGSAVYCRLRSANRGNSTNVWAVNTSGYLSSYGSAANAFRCQPACVIY